MDISKLIREPNGDISSQKAAFIFGHILAAAVVVMSMIMRYSNHMVDDITMTMIVSSWGGKGWRDFTKSRSAKKNVKSTPH